MAEQLSLDLESARLKDLTSQELCLELDKVLDRVLSDSCFVEQEFSCCEEDHKKDAAAREHTTKVIEEAMKRLQGFVREVK